MTTARTLSRRIAALESAKRAAAAHRLSVNPDDEAEYDAACDRYETARFALERALLEYWRATDPDARPTTHPEAE